MQKGFKKLIGWLHLWLGLISGIILMVVALTGGLLAFEDELELILFKQRHIVQPAPQRLTADSLVSIANHVFPGKKLARLIIETEPDRSVEARIGGKGKAMKIAYINPYTGKVLYKGSYQQQFYQQVRNLHRYLLLDEAGKVVTGISCSICLFLTISGIILWWPANKKAIKQRYKIKWDASGKRLNWDLHAVTGFYLSIFLVVITLTGLVWSYDWVENLIFQIADGKVQKEAKVKNLVKLKKAETGIFQKMENEMERLYPYPGTLAFNILPKGGLAVGLQKESALSTVRRTDAAFFDSKTGRLVKQQPYTSLSTGTKIRRMILPIHSGSVFGWPTKLLALIVTLFTASLPVTGLLIWLGKRKKPKKSKRPTRPNSKPLLVTPAAN